VDAWRIKQVLLNGNEETAISGTSGRSHSFRIRGLSSDDTEFLGLAPLGENWAAVTLPVVGGTPRRLGGELLADDVAWSHNGQVLAYSRDQHIFLANPDGTGSRELATLPGRAAYLAWSPDDRTIYAVSTGYHPLSGPGSSTSQPRAGLCDAAFAFSAASSAQSTLWVNYTGCDSYYGVVADSQNVYVGGHERWANNPNGCDFAGPGALSRPGLADLNPVGGSANSWNPTRSLGHGVDDLVLTTAGLWVASDTFKLGKSQMCGHQTNHGGICFLPY